MQATWKLELENTNLRSDVVWCPTEGLGCLITSDALLAHAKVCDLNMSVLVQQYIIQFQISVNNPSCMEVEQPDCNLSSIEPVSNESLGQYFIIYDKLQGV